MTGETLLLQPDDDVAVALRDLPGVPRGHKVAVRDLASGAPIRKYGQLIGVATAPITAGSHVHTHNLGMGPHDRDYAFGTDVREVEPVPAPAHFQGIRRPDGRVATRNYIGILTSVNCSATVARMIAARASTEGFPNVDGVVALTHGTGCGMASDGDGIRLLRRTLNGYARHPNFAAILVIGLGCEVNQLTGFDLPADTPTMTIQELGGTSATVRRGLEVIRELLPAADAVTRVPVPASELVLGLQCGGSDGYSGITANPALGAAADLLVRHGGTAILAETPEVYGAEHLLTRRAVSRAVGERLVSRIRWWESYAESMDNNPSPGNKAGGLTTILEKSLGAVAKGGTTPLTAVYEYAEPVTSRGFVFMDTPGYDPVSATGEVAGGANLICFTTGRGSVYGCRPAPSLKLASNREVYRAMAEDMDVDCGVILDGEVTVAELGSQIFDLVLEVASGRKTASEELGFGDEEFAPWQLGAVM
ncbi:altronate dehydratase family protein [Actinoallomurus bryophytorum]|uniref:Altronate hydrolase n=1 Tax=Actinoallomurus bryophytorum TaxID=1490222 RepID=A0A543CEQ7_9ACTN|nr:altronate dehydratase family protein [Actinoallomurus bryophytorum]TQL95576.1 altronate hydrolase [Actinoallomurus bryophytorum]